MSVKLPSPEDIESYDGNPTHPIPVVIVTEDGDAADIGGGGGSGGSLALPAGASQFLECNAEEVTTLLEANEDRISATVQNLNDFNIRITEDDQDPSATVGFIMKPYTTAKIETNMSVRTWSDQSYFVAVTETGGE